jgi:hypothetical protein
VLIEMLIIVLAGLLTAEVVRMSVRRVADMLTAEFAGRSAGGFVAFCFALHPNLGIRQDPLTWDIVLAAAAVATLGSGLTFLKDRYVMEWLLRRAAKQ